MASSINSMINNLMIKGNTVLNSGYGNILVEVQRDLQSMQVVKLVPWDEAPITKLTKRAIDRKESYDYYASIASVITDANIIRYYIYEVFARQIIYSETGYKNPPQEYVDTAIAVYADDDEIKDLPTNLLVKVYLKNHFTPILRTNNTIKEMATEIVRFRYNNVARILEKGKRLIKEQNPYLDLRIGADITPFAYDMTAVIMCMRDDLS